MKKILGLVLAFALAFALAFSCPSTLTFAAEIDTPADQPIDLPEILQLSTSQTVTAANGYKAKITINYATNTDSSNSSGEKIIAINGGSASKVSGWTSVASNITINSVTYTQNYQVASISVTYFASVGEGNQPYTTIVTVSLL